MPVKEMKKKPIEKERKEIVEFKTDSNGNKIRITKTIQVKKVFVSKEMLERKVGFFIGRILGALGIIHIYIITGFI